MFTICTLNPFQVSKCSQTDIDVPNKGMTNQVCMPLFHFCCCLLLVEISFHISFLGASPSCGRQVGSIMWTETNPLPSVKSAILQQLQFATLADCSSANGKRPLRIRRDNPFLEDGDSSHPIWKYQQLTQISLQPTFSLSPTPLTSAVSWTLELIGHKWYVGLLHISTPVCQGAYTLEISFSGLSISAGTYLTGISISTLPHIFSWPPPRETLASISRCGWTSTTTNWSRPRINILHCCHHQETLCVCPQDK